MLKEANSTFRIIIIEIIIKNFKQFNEAKILDEFIPLFIDEVEKCFDFSEDWIIANFTLTVQFLLSTNVTEVTYIEAMQKFWQVLFRSKHREQLHLINWQYVNWLFNPYTQ